MLLHILTCRMLMLQTNHDDPCGHPQICFDGSTGSFYCSVCSMYQPPDSRYDISDISKVRDNSSCAHSNVLNSCDMTNTCLDCGLVVETDTSGKVRQTLLQVPVTAPLVEAARFVLDFDQALRNLDGSWASDEGRQVSLCSFECTVRACLMDGCHGGCVIVFHNPRNDTLTCRAVLRG